MAETLHTSLRCFNPLDRVKFVQMRQDIGRYHEEIPSCFNPLDRVKFVQMFVFLPTILWLVTGFQSPRSGQICSNARGGRRQVRGNARFNPLDRVKFVQIIQPNQMKGV